MSKKTAKFPIHLKEENKRSLRLFPIQCFWKSKHGISYYPHLPFSCDKLLQLRREEECSKSSSVLWAAWHIFRWRIKVPSIKASIFSDPEGFSYFLKLEWQLLQICIESSPQDSSKAGISQKLNTCASGLPKTSAVLSFWETGNVEMPLIVWLALCWGRSQVPSGCNSRNKVEYHWVHSILLQMEEIQKICT